VRAVAESAQHVERAFDSMRKVITAAYTHHRRPAELSCLFLCLTGNMSEVRRVPGIGDIENGSPVWLDLTGQGIELFSTMVADVSNPAFTLPLDDGLIGAPRLQVIVTDKINIALSGFPLRCRLTRQKTGARPTEHQQSRTSYRIVSPTHMPSSHPECFFEFRHLEEYTKKLSSVLRAR
jgi:hypothetical protein